MATNKHAIIRYEALDRCFSNRGRKFFMEDLMQYVSTAIEEYTGSSTSISRRQLFKDIDFMRSETGFRAPIVAFKEGKKAFYKYEDPNYSMGMQQINPIEAELLKNAIEVLGRFKGIAQFDFIPELSLKLKKAFQLEELDQIIFFDHNEYLKNLDYLGDLTKLIRDRQAVHMTYQSFNQDKEEVFIIHPYFLKQYNKRWFLFGQRAGFDNWTNLALDRIVTFTIADGTPFLSTTDSPEHYFEDLIGVSKPIELDCQLVQVKINKSLWPYIQSKPLHPSQKVIEKAAEHTTIQLEVVPNYEFYAQILGFGASVQVLEPAHIREEIKNKILKNLNNY
ncbi:helix-turn-helix transcriptional regulator [Sphingobacterium kitahiroshimense]|uniref:WYL domain-containing protein n=1 Tax=Sphingobacterium kitahiroshimense TaxID=470446 RepID=A0ABV0C1B2_9SPHI